MKNITRTQYQAFPFHLVEPSPWPILTSFALLTLTVSAVLYFHGFVNGGELLTLGFILVSGGMVLWFRDVITEGTKKIDLILIAAKALSKDYIFQEYNKYCKENSYMQNNPYRGSNSSKELGHYLAGLLEGEYKTNKRNGNSNLFMKVYYFETNLSYEADFF